MRNNLKYLRRSDFLAAPSRNPVYLNRSVPEGIVFGGQNEHKWHQETCLFFDVFYLGVGPQNFPGYGQQGLAFVGQDDAAAVAHEQGGADFGLQGGDVLGHRRLADAQPLGGLGKIQAVGQRGEYQ